MLIFTIHDIQQLSLYIILSKRKKIKENFKPYLKLKFAEITIQHNHKIQKFDK